MYYQRQSGEGRFPIFSTLQIYIYYTYEGLWVIPGGQFYILEDFCHDRTPYLYPLRYY